MSGDTATAKTAGRSHIVLIWRPPTRESGVSDVTVMIWRLLTGFAALIIRPLRFPIAPKLRNQVLARSPYLRDDVAISGRGGWSPP